MPDPVLVFEDDGIECRFVDVGDFLYEIDLLEHHLRGPEVPKLESFFCNRPAKYFPAKSMLELVEFYLSAINRGKADCFHDNTQATVLEVLKTMRTELKRAAKFGTNVGIDFL